MTGWGLTNMTRLRLGLETKLFVQDSSGQIEDEELSGFLKDLLELVKNDYDTSDLEDFARTIMKGCDINRDGKVSKKVRSVCPLSGKKVEKFPSFSPARSTAISDQTLFRKFSLMLFRN